MLASYRGLKGWDIPHIADAELLTESPDRWSSNGIVDEISRDDSGMIVACISDHPIGYASYRRDERRGLLRLARILVHPDYRMKGIGASLLESVRGKCSAKCPRGVAARCRETDADAIGFFRACSGRAFRVERGAFGREDAIVFSFKPLAVAF